MRRGEVWRYAAKGPRGDRHVVIVSGSGINTDPRRSFVTAVDILSADPGDLLAVQIPGLGWADVSTVSRVFRRWCVEHVETLDTETMTSVDVALRAALDL